MRLGTVKTVFSDIDHHSQSSSPGDNVILPRDLQRNILGTNQSCPVAHKSDFDTPFASTRTA